MFDKNNPFQGMPNTEGMPVNKAFEILEPTISDAWMEKAIETYFSSQKVFADFLGVGASTVTNWVKTHSFPDQAKRLLVYTLLGKLTEVSTNKEKSKLLAELGNLKGPTVVEDGGTFSIVGPEVEDIPHSRRKVIARGIPEFQTALHMAGSTDAWEFIDTIRGILVSDIVEKIREESDALGFDEDDIEAITDGVNKLTFPLLKKHNALMEKWTDPKTLRQKSEAMLKMFDEIDWGDVLDSVKLKTAGGNK